MTLTTDQIAGVKATLENYRAAYQKKDFRALVAAFAPDATGFGSGADEVFSSRKEYGPLLKRDLEQASSVVVEFQGMQIFGDGRVAWVTTGCSAAFTIPGIGKQVMQGRMTIVLRDTGKKWLIEQWHFSVPNIAQEPGQSFSNT